MLAYAYLGKGDLARAESTIEESLDGLDPENFDSPQPYYVMIAHAEVELAIGKYERALQMLDGLIATMKRIGIRPFLPGALYLKSKVLLAAGQSDEAQAVLREARDAAESLGERLSLIPILSALGKMEAERGDGGEAQALRGQAQEFAQSIAANLPPDLRTRFLNSPDVLEALGPS